MHRPSLIAWVCAVLTLNNVSSHSFVCTLILVISRSWLLSLVHPINNASGTTLWRPQSLVYECSVVCRLLPLLHFALLHLHLHYFCSKQLAACSRLMFIIGKSRVKTP